MILRRAKGGSPEASPFCIHEIEVGRRAYQASFTDTESVALGGAPQILQVL